MSVTEDDCTCDWVLGQRFDDPGCPYHHPKK